MSLQELALMMILSMPFIGLISDSMLPLVMNDWRSPPPQPVTPLHHHHREEV